MAEKEEEDTSLWRHGNRDGLERERKEDVKNKGNS